MDLPAAAEPDRMNPLMRIPALAAALALASCTPPVETKDPTPASAAAPVVPYAKLGWSESRFTWEGKPFTGVTTDQYKSGQLKARYGIKEGLYHGLVEEWYENGHQKTRTSYENGRHQGDNFYWNADGSLQVHKVWKDDRLLSEKRPEKAP